MITTIEREHSGTSSLVVFCETCRPNHATGGKHLDVIPHEHRGYGHDISPLTESDKEAGRIIATEHDKQFPDHSIVIYHYNP